MATSTITNLSNVNELVEVQLDNVTNTSGSYSHATTVSGITPDHKVLTIECGNKAAFRAPITISTGTNSITLTCSDVVGSSTVKVGVIIAGSGFPIVSAEYGALSNRVGNLSDLTTSDKSSIVNSINSVNEEIVSLCTINSTGSQTVSNLSLYKWLFIIMKDATLERNYWTIPMSRFKSTSLYLDTMYDSKRCTLAISYTSDTTINCTTLTKGWTEFYMLYAIK